MCFFCFLTCLNKAIIAAGVTPEILEAAPRVGGLIKDNFSVLGTYGSDWVAFESDGAYEGLHLNVGQGYWLGLADDNTLSLTGNPVTGDSDDMLALQL